MTISQFMEHIFFTFATLLLEGFPESFNGFLLFWKNQNLLI
jgi:hypothetical protein